MEAEAAMRRRCENLRERVTSSNGVRIPAQAIRRISISSEFSRASFQNKSPPARGVEPAAVSFDTAGCLECGSRANSALKPGSMVVARTWWLIFSPAHRACASIDGSYRIHCELVFHIELFLRFIRLRSSQVRSWLWPSSAGSKAGVVAGSTLLRTENRADGSIASWLSVQE
jgi:hypothetical protein